MSDLISRSQLLKEIETWGGCVEALHEYIQNMPISYDVDEVVEQLEELRELDACDFDNCSDEDTRCRDCVQKRMAERAIEIVKAGGNVNE